MTAETRKDQHGLILRFGSLLKREPESMVAIWDNRCFNHAIREELVHCICCAHYFGDQCVIHPLEATRKQPKHIRIFPLNNPFVVCVFMRRRKLEMDGELREDVSSLKCRGAA